MGLKSGSRDAGLDEDDEEAASDPDQQGTSDAAPETGSQASDAAAESETRSGSDDRPSMDAIPYVLRRSRVNEGRDQVPFFLRDEVLEGGDDLQESLEAMLGEEVYKSDYREAAMVVAQRQPELVAEVLREWGYDLD